MTETRKTSHSTGLPYAGLRCPGCEYDLTGASEPRCPECGKVFDPDKLRAEDTWWNRKPSWYTALIVVILAWYLLNTWPLWIQGEIVWSNTQIIPSLPALYVAGTCCGRTALLNSTPEDILFTVLAFISTAMVAASFWIGRRSRRALLSIAIIVLLFQVFTATFAVMLSLD